MLGAGYSGDVALDDGAGEPMHEAITIRRMAADEENEVLRAGHLFDSPPDREAVRAFLADSRNYLLVAFYGAEPVGFVRAHIFLQLDTTRPRMFLYEIAVVPSHRRRGIARRLISGRVQACVAHIRYASARH